MKKTENILRCLLVISLFISLMACAPKAPTAQDSGRAPVQEKSVSMEAAGAADADGAELMAGQLPVRFQQPAYLIKHKTADEQLGIQAEADISIPVGADISSTTGPVPLREILKRLAALKSMNVSWGSDVDQFAMVDFDIRAEDDFFQAIDNILRQLEYFHEVQGNTIVVKFRETRKFHIAMPFMSTTYNSAVGGDVLGASGQAGSMKGNIEVVSDGNKFDVWENISKNLDQILEIWDETAPVYQDSSSSQSGKSELDQTQTEKKSTSTTRYKNVNAKGYYTIDKPIGLITVTAPRPLVEKIAVYINNLKKELFRQISIEAKIVEVTLTDGSLKGVDWTKIFSFDGGIGVDFELFGSGDGGVIFGPGVVYPGSNRVVGQVNVTNPFTLVLDAIERQGKTKVLANPKISVMNGQPALISVGENVKYIDSVESKVEEGVITYTVTTDSVMSGLGMSVVATVMEGNEIILSLTPVTSKLTEPIEYRNFGGVNQVGLPRVQLRELNTVVRIKDGDMLVVGGLIDNVEVQDDTKLPILGDLPVINRLFKSESTDNAKKELVILLMPKIIS